MATRWNCAWVNFGLTEQRRRRSSIRACLQHRLQPHTANGSWLPSASWLSLVLSGNRVLRKMVRSSSFLASGKYRARSWLWTSCSETTFSFTDTVCDNSGLKLHITLYTLLTQQPVLKPMIRLWRQVVLQIRKVVVCLLLNTFSPKGLLGQVWHISCVALLGQVPCGQQLETQKP